MPNKPAAAAPETENKTGTDVVAADKAPVTRSFPVVGQAASIGGKRFVVKKQVTRNVFKQEEGKSLAVRFEGPVYQGEQLANSRTDGPKMEPARLAAVENLETGEHGLLIINKVLEGRLVESYPLIDGAERNNDGTPKLDAENKPVTGKIPGYIGKCLVIEMVPGPAGKRYKGFNIVEIEEAE